MKEPSRTNQELLEEISALKQRIRELEQSESERTQVEEALRKSEANYRQLFDKSPTGIFQANFRTKKFTKANDAFCEYLGYSQEEITSLSPYDILTNEGKQLFSERLNKMRLGDKVPENPEFEIIDKNGKQRWVQLNTKNIYDSEGLAGADVVAHDITDRRRVEEELKKRERDLKSKSRSLEELNTTLKVLLKQREQDKDEIEENVLANIKQLVMPYIEKLKKSRLNTKEADYVHILEANLNAIISPFSNKLSSKNLYLTPKEIQIINLIKEGKTTKDIAELMNISLGTVGFHRDNIRIKLNLKNNKTNLRSYLLTLT